ncbi:unnamed protein product [Heligmosomoides polygyrus]|uniref:26S proteasome non-ATPase regulatory subunit 8 n=1 Tax=Heligmosomoides polygyrus TaxID=6339 RepID=A0A3P7YVD8_HELPZ|nr:unnamed protein product [Heligmosomoides polygyrus]
MVLPGNFKGRCSAIWTQLPRQGFSHPSRVIPMGPSNRNGHLFCNRSKQCVSLSDYYEISALVSVLRNDMAAFGDAIPRVLSFYDQCPTAAENKYLMVGLNLMFLLASNRLSDFHMLLESVPQNIQSTNPYISTPVRLEQSLNEGAYNKVILTEKTIPSQFYSIFIRIMMDAVRSDIAVSIEKSFKLLSTRDAANMLLFSSDAQVDEFAKQRKWKSEHGCFVFEAETGHTDKPTLDTTRIAKQTIFYAKQLEMIV